MLCRCCSFSQLVISTCLVLWTSALCLCVSSSCVFLHCLVMPFPSPSIPPCRCSTLAILASVMFHIKEPLSRVSPIGLAFSVSLVLCHTDSHSFHCQHCNLDVFSREVWTFLVFTHFDQAGFLSLLVALCLPVTCANLIMKVFCDRAKHSTCIWLFAENQYVSRHLAGGSGRSSNKMRIYSATA